MSFQKDKRDIAEEIRQLRSRKEFEAFWQIKETFKQIQVILSDLQKAEVTSNKELLKYIPVNLVGSMESFLRSTSAKLINRGGIYMDNAKTLVESSSIKFDFDTMRHIHKREFTIGEFLAHQLSFSNYKQIHLVFSKLLASDFTKTINDFNALEFFENPYRNQKIKSFSHVSKHVFSDLNRLFEIRHIICHEMAITLELDLKEIKRITGSTKLFIYQIYYYVYVILFPENFEKDEDIAVQAKKDFEKADMELETYFEFIKDNPKSSLECDVDYSLLIESHELWKDFRDKYLKALCNNCKDDDAHVLYYELAKELTVDRLEDLQFEFENKIGLVS